MPISGLDLTKPGVFPEQRPCGEDSRKKWIEVFLLSSFKKSLLGVILKGILPPPSSCLIKVIINFVIRVGFETI